MFVINWTYISNRIAVFQMNRTTNHTWRIRSAHVRTFRYANCIKMYTSGTDQHSRANGSEWVWKAKLIFNPHCEYPQFELWRCQIIMMMLRSASVTRVSSPITRIETVVWFKFIDRRRSTWRPDNCTNPNPLMVEIFARGGRRTDREREREITETAT